MKVCMNMLVLCSICGDEIFDLYLLWRSRRRNNWIYIFIIRKFILEFLKWNKKENETKISKRVIKNHKCLSPLILEVKFYFKIFHLILIWPSSVVISLPEKLRNLIISKCFHNFISKMCKKAASHFWITTSVRIYGRKLHPARDIERQ